MIDIARIAKTLKRNIKDILRTLLWLDRRSNIAKKYIRGDGIEIGALHNPLGVPKSARVKYLDRIPVDELRKQYPELNAKEFVKLDLIGDGERLDSIQDHTQDFVIANHFIEHCENPIGAIKNMLRVLKNDGILYLALPDKRYTFDVDRPVTSLEHLMKDYEEGPDWSKRNHFEEWTRLVNKVQDDAEAEKQITQLMNSGYSIHFHVWTQTAMLELILSLKESLDFELELFLKSGSEIIFILKKA